MDPSSSRIPVVPAVRGRALTAVSWPAPPARGPASSSRIVVEGVSVGGVTALERYEARAKLFDTTLGEVHLCRDRRIGRDVELHVIRAEHAKRPELRRRFLREGRIVGQLEHPAILPVYDVGSTEDGTAFFTTLHVEGVPLAEALRRAPDDDDAFTLRQLLEALVAVAGAIEFAHGRGVVHRGLDADTVLLTSAGETYVRAWSLAAVEGDGLDPTTDVVALGALLAAVAQVSPTPYPELTALAEAAIAREAAHRLPSVAAFREGLTGLLARGASRPAPPSLAVHELALGVFCLVSLVGALGPVLDLWSWTMTFVAAATGFLAAFLGRR